MSKKWGGQLQGRFQELKGGGAEVKYVRAKISCPLWCIKGYAKLGGGKLGEANSRSRLHTRAGVLGKDVFPLRGARKNKNCIHTIDCLL